MNNVELSGRLVRDPELKYIRTKGTALCQFSLVINSGKGDQKQAHFFDCKAWKDTATGIVENYRKGDLVDVRGFLTQETWESAGAKKSKVVIVVTDHRIPGTGSDQDQRPAQQAPPQTRTQAPARRDPGAYVPPAPIGGVAVGDIDIPFAPDYQWA